MPRPLHQRVHTTALFDALREPIARNGAWKSPSPQSERAAAENSHMAAMDTSGLGQAATGGRASRTYTGGELNPQVFPTAAGPNTDISLSDAGVAMNARSSYPGRGLTPNPQSPMARRA